MSAPRELTYIKERKNCLNLNYTTKENTYNFSESRERPNVCLHTNFVSYAIDFSFYEVEISRIFIFFALLHNPEIQGSVAAAKLTRNLPICLMRISKSSSIFASFGFCT